LIYFVGRTADATTFSLYAVSGSTYASVVNAPTSVAEPIVYGGQLYLSGTIDGAVGWFSSSDGVRFTAVAGAPSSPSSPILYAGNLYLNGFTAGAIGWFKFDGTTFTQVANIYVRSGVELNGILYFREPNAGNPWDIFEYDGNSIYNLTAQTNYEVDTSYVVYEGKLYFGADTGTDNWSLYTYLPNGGFSKVSAPGINPQTFAVADGQLYYRARDKSNNWNTYQYAPPVPVDVTSGPTVSGTAMVGQTLAADTHVWQSGTSVSYDWYVTGRTTVSPNHTSTYTVQPADVGQVVFVIEKGSMYGFSTNSSLPGDSATIKPGKLTSTPHPTITGKAKASHTLTAHAGTWKPSPIALHYQWYRNGSAIHGATKATHHLSTADRHKYITVVVTGSSAGYVAVKESSAREKVG
jgi:hypothetical protein